MTPSPGSEFSLELTCLHHLVALKYAMAGDMESDALLRQVEERWRLIHWEDPEFIKFSDAMRNGPAHLISQSEQATVPELRATVHDQAELLASFSERAALLISQHNEARKKLGPALDAGLKILTYLQELLSLAIRMRARLRAIGEDTSSFQLPSSPFPPIS